MLWRYSTICKLGDGFLCLFSWSGQRERSEAERELVFGAQRKIVGFIFKNWHFKSRCFHLKWLVTSCQRTQFVYETERPPQKRAVKLKLKRNASQTEVESQLQSFDLQQILCHLWKPYKNTFILKFSSRTGIRVQKIVQNLFKISPLYPCSFGGWIFKSNQTLEMSPNTSNISN